MGVKKFLVIFLKNLLETRYAKGAKQWPGGQLQRLFVNVSFFDIYRR